MPRIPRTFYSSNFFHVIVQGINKEYIFSKEEYMKKYKENLLKYRNNYNIIIISYCIMNNHAHMLLYSENILNISQFMKSVNTSYAAYYNKVQERVGYVFRDRFLSEPITNKKYLFNCIAYIHNNPVKANIVRSADEYSYSSFKDYINKTGIGTEEVLNLVFDSNSDYINKYFEIHNTEAEFKDIQGEYLNYKCIIEDFEKNVKMTIHEIKNNKECLKKLVQKLKDDSGLSIRKISRILDIDRRKLSKMLK